MEITGNIIHILPAQTGQGKNGPWKKQEFVIETTDSYPKKVCLAAWGDKVDLGSYKTGQSVKVSFDVESREYNGKWYTDLKAYNVTSTKNDMPSARQENDFSPEQQDDLPF
jgi:hypothetical protein